MTYNELIFPLGVLTSGPILVKIDQEMRPPESPKRDTLTDANRFLPRCMECRRGLVMTILSVRPSVCQSVCLSVRQTRGL